MIDLRKSAELNNITPVELYVRFKRFPHSEKRVICYCEVCGCERNVSYRDYCDLCHKCANVDPVRCEKISISHKEYWSYQENRDAQSERKKEYYSHQENIDMFTERSKEYWSHQENRDAQGEKMNDYYSHQENRDVVSERSTEYYSQQENRDKMSVIKTEYWSCQENRDAQSKRITQHHKDHPETSEMLIERSKRISAGHQGISYDDWEDFVYNLNSPYCPDFNGECRESNREKYSRKCFICGLLEEENITKNGDNWKLSVHHYDMDKEQGCNGKIWKLIPVCLKCHGIVHNKLWESRITWLLKNVWNNQNLYIG